MGQYINIFRQNDLPTIFYYVKSLGQFLSSCDSEDLKVVMKMSFLEPGVIMSLTVEGRHSLMTAFKNLLLLPGGDGCSALQVKIRSQ